MFHASLKHTCTAIQSRATKAIKSLTLAIICIGMSPTAQASVVTYEVGGSAGGSQVLFQDQAVAQSFVMNETLTDASLSFNVLCYDCVGDIYLITGTPAVGATVAQFETTQSYTINGNVTLQISGRTLVADQEYTLIWSVFEGDGFWRATRDPEEFGTSARYGQASWTDDVDQGYPANSTFTDLASTAKFQIAGVGTLAPASVPLPATLPLLLSGLLGAATYFRRMRN